MASSYECAIIGAGPAGLVAAVYLGRFKRSTVVIDGGDPRAIWIPRIRNLIGYTDGLSGRELLKRVHKQVDLYHVDFVQGRAVVNTKRKCFEISVGDRKIQAQKVILATGMTDLQPPIPNFQELRAKGLLGYCPICDGYDHGDEPVALIIDGEHGLHKIKFIARMIRRLHIVAIDDCKIPRRYLNFIQDRKLHLYRGHLEKMEPLTKTGGLKISLKGQPDLSVKMAYIELGVRVEDSAFGHLKNLGRTHDGFLTVSTHQETAIPGLYAVGDCVHGLSQVSVAVGQAAIAACHAHNQLPY